MIPKVPEPTGATGSSDFYYGSGVMPFPTSRLSRPQVSPFSVLSSTLAEALAANVNLIFTSTNGSIPQLVPDSRVILETPVDAVVLYAGKILYDVFNPTGNSLATLMGEVVVDDSPSEVTKSVFALIPGGKGFESITDQELYALDIWHFALVKAGSHQFGYRVWVDNPSALTAGNLQLKISNRQWTAVAFIATFIRE